MGSLLQIPSNVNLSTLGPALGYSAGFETVLGLKLATCAQQYGYYPVDTTGSAALTTGNEFEFEVAIEPFPGTGAMFRASDNRFLLDAYVHDTWGFGVWADPSAAYQRDIFRILSALCVNLLNGPSDGVHGSGGGTAIVPYLSSTFSD
jgi:hypothetical protein